MNNFEDAFQWHLTFLDYADSVAEQSTCLSDRVGAAIVKSGTSEIIGHGWNSVPDGEVSCIAQGYCYAMEDRVIKECGQTLYPSRSIHAEINAIADVMRKHKDPAILQGATVYVTHEPCISCVKSCIAHGIGAIFYAKPGKPSYVKSQYHQQGIIDLVQVNITEVEEEPSHD